MSKRSDQLLSTPFFQDATGQGHWLVLAKLVFLGEAGLGALHHARKQFPTGAQWCAAMKAASNVGGTWSYNCYHASRVANRVLISRVLFRPRNHQEMVMARDDFGLVLTCFDMSAFIYSKCTRISGKRVKELENQLSCRRRLLTQTSNIVH